MSTDGTPWASTPIITIYAATCPHCKAQEHYDRDRTDDNGDGSRTKKAICRTCGKRFRIVIEPLPVSGSWVQWPGTIPATR